MPLPVLAALLWAVATNGVTVEDFMIDFHDGDASAWFPVNDGVMGGLSSSTLTISAEGHGLFSGRVSLANNGGFASVRTAVAASALAGAAGLVVRVRGDGRPYRLRLRTDGNIDGIAYQAEFSTEPGQWIERELPFSAFKPVFRGRSVPGAPALEPGAIRQIGLMIADKQSGPFALEIAWIRSQS